MQEFYKRKLNIETAEPTRDLHSDPFGMMVRITVSEPKNSISYAKTKDSDLYFDQESRALSSMLIKKYPEIHDLERIQGLIKHLILDTRLNAFDKMERLGEVMEVIDNAVNIIKVDSYDITNIS